MTCSDEGVPMRIVASAVAQVALCEDDEGSRSEVMTDLVGEVEIGDAVLVHAGVALGRLG